MIKYHILGDECLCSCHSGWSFLLCVVLIKQEDWGSRQTLQSRGWAAGWCAVKGSGFRNKSEGSSPPQRLRETAEAELVACISRSGLQTISEQKCKSLNQGRSRSQRAEVGETPAFPSPFPSTFSHSLRILGFWWYFILGPRSFPLGVEYIKRRRNWWACYPKIGNIGVWTIWSWRNLRNGRSRRGFLTSPWSRS